MKLPGRYKKTNDKVLKGGMSEALICNDEHLERPVLIKRLQDGMDQSRLLDEIGALAAIRSKHVVQIFDLLKDTDGEIYGLVEEYLPGSDLEEMLPLHTLDEFLKHGYAVACGISDIHERGRVHRDIKPTNMKFDAEACLKIFDFGLSRPDDTNAKTVGTTGTPGYLAPELCVKDYEEVAFSQPIDVYAFGASALQMLRGTLPLDLKKIPPKLPCPTADFTKQTVALPKSIAEALNACLNPNPKERPKMRDVRDLLAAQLLGDRHKATLVIGNEIHTLSAKNKTVNININSVGSIQIKYDGLQFVITAVSGSVTINNLPVTKDQALPGSCVVILGDASLGANRRYITVDVSHPEVVL